VLAGFLVPESEDEEFKDFLSEAGYRFVDETKNLACTEFLSPPEVLKPALGAVIPGVNKVLS